MIMKENKQIGFIYKNNESIDKIIKDGEVVFERGFLRERTSTTLPITFGGVGKDLKDYRVYGNTYQNSTSGKNICLQANIVDANTIRFDINSNGINQIFTLSLIPPLSVNSMSIVAFADGVNLRSVGTINLINGERSTTTITLTESIYNTIQNASEVHFNLYKRGAGISTTSIIEEPQIENNSSFTSYEPYTGGQPSPNPDYPQEIVSCGDNETGLPFGYTQVDFIENSGTQYIDTGFKPNQDTSIEMEVLIPEDSNDITRFFESRNQTSVRESFGIINFKDSNNQIQLRYNTQKGAAPGLNTNTKYKITTDKKQLYVDDVLVLTANNATFQVNYNLYLFGFANASSLVNPSVNGTYKLYNFKIYDNDTLIRNFIPCYRNSDNEVGLYDLVNNVFYTNQGTGVFTYGSEIEKGGYKIPININGNITNIYLNEPLRKIGEYSDYIDFINGKAVRKIRKIILDGSENWVLADIYNNISQFDYSNALIKKFTTTDNIALFANYFGTTNRWPQSWLKDNIALHRVNQNAIRLQSSNFTTLEDFKTWLSTHNTIVDYVLATPIEEDIELPNIPTLDGSNTLNIETEITPSQVYIKYKSNE